jgi:hypothetical protein
MLAIRRDPRELRAIASRRRRVVEDFSPPVRE